MAAALDLADIQGDILRAYGNAYDCTTYAFVGVDDARAGRDWLGAVAGRVTTAEPWSAETKPQQTVNIAVTASGLRALGVPEGVVQTFSGEFRQGMAARATLLGDTGQSDPDRWEDGLRAGALHVLVTVNTQTDEQLERALRDLRAEIADAGLRVVHEQHAHLLPGAREHFGYSDGFAQPAVQGSSDDKARGGGVPEAGGGWRALAPGEFVLGYPDEDTREDPHGRLPRAPADPLGRSGTYMVWRKLYQDVALFRRMLRDAARLYEGGDEERLSAKVVGRWRDGTPLVLSPEAPQRGFSATAPGANDFRYDHDGDGLRCPLGAHIRRSNPRDALGFEGRLSFRHRMIRRGMPYGPPLAEDVHDDDGQDRGLIFVCFQASISRQFEGVQIQWLNDGNIFGLGHDKDFLMGDATGTGKMTVQGRPPFFLGPQQSFVTTRGGDYLFVPGIAALRAIADGTTG